MNHEGPVVAEQYNLKVIHCRACGFRHLDPIPDNSALYSSGRFYHDLKSAYSHEYHEDREWWQAVYGDWLARIELIAPNHTLVDVGAGTGDFVRCAAELGWSPDGIEPDPDMARRHWHFHGGYRDYDRPGVGVVSAHWVMEHLQDPVDFLRWAWALLVKRGVLLVTIPNDFTQIQARAMEAVAKPFYWLHSTHINYWGLHSFIAFLERNGFAVQVGKIMGAWQPEKHLIEGRNYLDDHALGRRLHKERMIVELNWGTAHRRRVMGERGLLGAGRDLTFVAVKK